MVVGLLGDVAGGRTRLKQAAVLVRAGPAVQ